MIVNVRATHTTTCGDGLSRYDLLAWLNNTLEVKFSKVEHLCTGAAYCQLMHSLFPNQIALKRVKLFTQLEHDFFDNFKMLQTTFQKLGVQKAIPIDRLIKGRFQDNIEFLQWFKKFYEANDKEDRIYDPVAARQGAPMGYGLKGTKKTCDRPTKTFSPVSGKGTFRSDEPILDIGIKRNLTKVQLKDEVVGEDQIDTLTKNIEFDDIDDDDDGGGNNRNINDVVVNIDGNPDTIVEPCEVSNLSFDEMQQALIDNQVENAGLRDKLTQVDCECQEARGKLTAVQKTRDKFYRKLKEIGFCIKEAEEAGNSSVETLKIASILLGSTSESNEVMMKNETHANEGQSIEL